MTDARSKTATFFVSDASEDSAILTDVSDAQVHTLSENPGLSAGDVLDATITPDPPMHVTYSVASVAEHTQIPVTVSDETPTPNARDLAADLPRGELATAERAGVGEIHVLSVGADNVSDAVDDVVADDQTVSRAARIGINRVEVRAGADFISVRYLP
ncbi:MULTISPECIES: DUF5812 family protein [Halobacterium]|uniref:Uncharacterized protein n=4 Tax=Halobacterium salinarum TaxID=2242 RepID=Q9HNQ8_HALSA|nr:MULTISPECIES: DUF5812 family protein [Halobacterium]AAG20162.1 hypothetical protein VNG_1989H [Halobacterium salinarum NRC-1]MBB6089175.1 hypothetical protein [Halobacterium salinarum]MCF2166230.1 hypothetical protein [Halobacterium salinarum]MCF2167713.1 hypothetical protein [Halobacterium salinarum]MCF2206498.1 hypothetical protein [Halobacterium salinarum]